MALFDSGVPLANVALSDTFNTWRVRTNQINTQAAGLASNNTFTGTLNTFNSAAAFKGTVTAPIVTANTVNGTAANFTTLQADSIDFDGDMTVDTVTANNLAGTITTAAQGNITSLGTLSALSVGGNITVTGTVDGRDVASDGTKLDGIESGATADQSAAEILTAIKTVDGAGSGLDADLLDGQSSAYFRDADNLNAGTVPVARVSGSYTSITGTGALNAGSITSGFGNIDVGSSSIDGGTITADTALVGTLSTAAQGNITSLGTLSSLTVSGTSTFNAAKFNNYVREEVAVIADNPAATQNYDVTAATVQYYTTAADANFTLNIRGDASTTLDSIMSTGDALSATLLVTNTGTAYYLSTLQIDGSTVTPEWSGGSAPSEGNADSIDSYTFTIIKTAASTFTTLATQTQFA